MDRLLVLVRHGQSDWNLRNLFTGWEEPDLQDKRKAETGGGRPKAEGARAFLRLRVHVGADPGGEHAETHFARGRPAEPADDRRSGAERARLWRSIMCRDSVTAQKN